MDEPAEQQPGQRQADHPSVAGGGRQREQQRQTAEQHDDDAEQAQREGELRAHQRADQQLADDVLLVEGAQGRADRVGGGRPGRGVTRTRSGGRVTGPTPGGRGGPAGP